MSEFLQEPEKPVTWTTRNGKGLLVTQMSTEHLRNAIGHVRRRDRNPHLCTVYDVTDGP